MPPKTAMTLTTIDLLASKMRQEGVPEPAIEAFFRLYDRIEQGKKAIIPESDIIPIGITEIPDLSTIQSHTSRGDAELRHTAVLKLNGGLGTTMGLSIPKSLIEVKDGLTFLDITTRQIRFLNESRGITIPLLLMNSFFTDTEIRKTLAGMSEMPHDFIHTFSQDKYPKVSADTLEPVNYPQNPSVEWNPAGHGDLFVALQTSGLLERLLDRGCRYLFVSNIDNLGAQIDPAILGYFAAEKLDFLMEVTDRTPMDRKGGHLARLRNGRLALREAAQCDRADARYFSDIARHRFFNTNNIWINLASVRPFLEKRKNLELPPVVSRKKLLIGDRNSDDVLHFESALGSGIALFDRSSALRVPRSRFAPVKSCEELLVLWSDNYRLMPDYRLQPNPERKSGPISISLDPDFYSRFEWIKSRFPCGAPSLVNCESFAVRGDVRFGCNVAVRGRVSITNTRAGQAFVRDNTDLGSDLTFGTP